MFKYLQFFGIVITLLMAGANLYAQEKPDHIYLLDGREIEVLIGSMDGRFVEFKRLGQPDTLSIRVDKSEIDKVKMANGTEIWFNALPKEAEPEKAVAEAPPADKKRRKKPAVSAQKIIRQR